MSKVMVAFAIGGAALFLGLLWLGKGIIGNIEQRDSMLDEKARDEMASRARGTPANLPPAGRPRGHSDVLLLLEFPEGSKEASAGGHAVLSLRGNQKLFLRPDPLLCAFASRVLGLVDVNGMLAEARSGEVASEGDADLVKLTRTGADEKTRETVHWTRERALSFLRKWSAGAQTWVPEKIEIKGVPLPVPSEAAGTPVWPMWPGGWVPEQPDAFEVEISAPGASMTQVLELAQVPLFLNPAKTSAFRITQVRAEWP